jgi:hypothetical protein
MRRWQLRERNSESRRRQRDDTACSCAVVQRKPLVIELRAYSVYMRLKGARWGYEVDYQSTWVLGAKKAAEQLRIESENRRKRSKRR